MAGLPTQPWEMPLSDAVLKGISIRGSYLGSRHELEEVFRLAVQGIGVPHVSTHPLTSVPALLDDMKQHRITGRAVVAF